MRAEVCQHKSSVERALKERETNSEGSAIRDPDGKIGEHGEEPVGGLGAEGKIVGDFMDGEEEVLVGGCAN